MPLTLRSLPNGIQNFLLATSAAAAAAGQAILGAISQQPEFVDWQGLLLGMGALSGVAGGALSGVLGNLATDNLKERLNDPQLLLRNQHLHRLAGTAVATLIQAQATLKLNLDAKDEARLLDDLAQGIKNDWEILSSTGGWKRQFDELSRPQIVEWMKQGGIDWSRQTALSIAQWKNLLRPLSKKHTADAIPDGELTRLAELLFTNYAAAVRELLKDDLKAGGHSFAAVALMVNGETLRILTEIAERQLLTQSELRALRASVSDVLKAGHTFLTQCHRSLEHTEKVIEA